MEKLKMMSCDIVNDNIERISKLFPECITEITDNNGKTEKAVNFAILNQIFNGNVTNYSSGGGYTRECYQFTWPDKSKARAIVNQPINATLRPCREESVNFDTTENLYIEGDNLDVLKLLRETYYGKVKMIYIDPPYNTGNDFVYEDDFSQDVESYKANSGQYDDQGNRLQKNQESNGRFHTDWLNMMYPRLKIARDLLSDDGVIFISIDDNEQKNLSKICDEIYGEFNFVGCIILQTATDNNPRQINTEHEYVLCYARNKTVLEPWYCKSEKAILIQNKYLELREKHGVDNEVIQKELRSWIKMKGDALSGVSHYDNVDDKGVFHDADIANTVDGGYKYEVIHPVTHRPCKIPEKGFRFAKSTMEEMLANNEIMFGVDETTLIKPKKRLENAKDVLRSVIYEDGRTSTKQFESLMARDVFQNPKSPMVLGRLINFIASEDDIVLDFFSGSGTTAEAVMRYNLKKGGRTRFIMVQIQEEIDPKKETSSKAKKIAENAIRFLDSINASHNICEIGKERIRRAGKKILEEQKNKSGDLFAESKTDMDVGFRVLKLDSSNMEDVYYTPDELKQGELKNLVDNIKEGRTDEDLLFQVMLDIGAVLSSKIEVEDINGRKVFNVSDKYLMACFDKDVDEDTITQIAKKEPVFFVMRDASLMDDSVSVNFDQIFNNYSPKTTRKVI